MAILSARHAGGPVEVRKSHPQSNGLAPTVLVPMPSSWVVLEAGEARRLAFELNQLATAIDGQPPREAT